MKKYLFLAVIISSSCYGSFVATDQCARGYADLFSSKKNCEQTTKMACVEFMDAEMNCQDYDLINGQLKLNMEKRQARRAKEDIEASNRAISEEKKRLAKEKLQSIDWSNADPKSVLQDVVEVIK